MVLGFSTTSFCNISGGPSEIPTMPAPWAARLVALPRWRGGAPRQTRRTTWRYSGFSFGPAIQMPGPNWTHRRDGPTHQERPQDKVRPQGQSLGRNLPQWVEEETDHLLGLPGREHQIWRPGDLGKGGIVITSECVCRYDCWLKEVNVSSTVLGLGAWEGPKPAVPWQAHKAGRRCQSLGDLTPPCKAGPDQGFMLIRQF